MPPDHGPNGKEHLSPQEDPLLRLTNILSRVSKIPERAMHVSVIQEFFEELSPHDAAFSLDHMIRRTITGDPKAPAALLAAVLWLLQKGIEAEKAPKQLEGTYDTVRAIYEAASEEGRTCVTNYLLDLPPHKTAKILRQNVTKLLKKEVSLGERKQMARGGNRQILDALIYDTEPQVLRKLCANPSIREQDILAIATRRPNQPQILRELALAPRWLSHYTVRLALLLNPYAPTGLSLKLTPFLRGTDLRKLALAGDLHPIMAQNAKLLLAIRSARSLKP